MPGLVSRSLHIRVVLPHFFGGESSEETIIGEGFGSRQANSRLQRSIALHRCISGFLNLSQSPQDIVLRMQDGRLIATPHQVQKNGFSKISVEIAVATVGNFVIKEVLDLFSHSISIIKFELDDPRQLGLAARDWLVDHSNPADLNIYSEDDLVVHDPLLPEKIIWAAEQSDFTCVLLPHRYEMIGCKHLPSRLFIDGPSNHEAIFDWHQPSDAFAKGLFRGNESVILDIPSNPHSGFFAVTRTQLKLLSRTTLPRDGFVGPLETAATYTVGSKFKILKPSLICRSFLVLEHAHPSYLGYLK